MFQSIRKKSQKDLLNAYLFHFVVDSLSVLLSAVEYVTNKDNIMKRYHIVATDNPSKKDLEKRLRLLEENLKEEKGYLIYPALSIGQIGKLTEEKEKIKIIIYQDATVCNAISLIYGNEDIKCDMDGYLEMLNSRRANADN